MSRNSPETLTALEQHALLNALLVKEGTHRQFRLGVRNHCIALLMLDAGLRVGEVVKLRQSDLLLATEPLLNLLIRKEISKTKTERTIPLSDRLRSCFREMYSLWWKPHRSTVCLSAFYNDKTSQPLTTRQVERIIGSASSRVLGRSVNPHVLRHTFASKLMRLTNARVVQDLLGHKQLSSTQVYTHPNHDDRKKAIDALTSKETAETEQST